MKGFTRAGMTACFVAYIVWVGWLCFAVACSSRAHACPIVAPDSVRGQLGRSMPSLCLPSLLLRLHRTKYTLDRACQRQVCGAQWCASQLYRVRLKFWRAMQRLLCSDLCHLPKPVCADVPAAPPTRPPTGVCSKLVEGSSGIGVTGSTVMCGLLVSALPRGCRHHPPLLAAGGAVRTATSQPAQRGPFGAHRTCCKRMLRKGRCVPHRLCNAVHMPMIIQALPLHSMESFSVIVTIFCGTELPGTAPVDCVVMGMACRGFSCTTGPARKRCLG